MNRKLLIGIVGGALSLVLTNGAVFASPSSGTTQAATTHITTAPPAPGTNAPDTLRGRRGPAGKLVLALVRQTADITGLKPQDVRQALRTDKSMAQIAQEHGKTGDDVVQAARAKLEERLKQAVSNGRITQVRADAALAAFDKAAPEIVQDTTLGKRAPHPQATPNNADSALLESQL